MIFLGFFYFFMVDIENHYIANPSTEADSGTFMISVYTYQAEEWWYNYLVLQDNTLALGYIFTYDLATVYLNPVQWIAWIIQGATALYETIVGIFSSE